jgi:hypothetical protein
MLGPVLIGLGIALAIYDHMTKKEATGDEKLRQDGPDSSDGDRPSGQRRGDQAIHGDRRLSAVTPKEVKADDGKPIHKDKSGLPGNRDSDNRVGEPDGSGGDGKAEAVKPGKPAKEDKGDDGSTPEKSGDDGASDHGDNVPG